MNLYEVRQLNVCYYVVANSAERVLTMFTPEPESIKKFDGPVLIDLRGLGLTSQPDPKGGDSDGQEDAPEEGCEGKQALLA